MIRLLFILFCFLAFSQDEKKDYSERVEEGVQKGVLAQPIPLDQNVYTNEEVSKELNGNDFLIVNGPGIYFSILIKSCIL